MFRFIAKIVAKVQYRFKQELEAEVNLINAGLSSRLAQERHDLVTHLTSEAEAMDARIKEMDAKLEAGFWECGSGHEVEKCSLALCDEHEGAQCNECKTGKKTCPVCAEPMKLIARSTMSGQEKYESDKERKEAEDIAKQKRDQAKAIEDEAANSEKAAKYFRDTAENNRRIAEKVRRL
jgi:hypothetical protein